MLLKKNVQHEYIEQQRNR